MRGKSLVFVLALLALVVCGAGNSRTAAPTEDVEPETETVWTEDVEIEAEVPVETETTEPADQQNADGEVASGARTAERYPRYVNWWDSLRSVLPDLYPDAVFFSEDRYLVYDDESRTYRFLSRDNEEVTPDHYEMAYPFYGGTACVCLDGKYGYIDAEGETVLPFIYDRAAPFSEGLAYFAIGDEYGFMDETGNPVFYLDCESVSSFREGRAYFYRDGKYGYIDENGEIVIPPIYDDAGYFWGGIAVVRIGGFCGLIDQDGTEILPLQYEWITAMGDGIVVAAKGEQEQYFDRNGEVSHAGDEGRNKIKDAFTVLTNEITPGAGVFYACIREGTVSAELTASMTDTRNFNEFGAFGQTCRLYALGDEGRTCLYFYADGYDHEDWDAYRLTYSAFFGEEDGTWKTLGTGYECGGSLGGDRMCLWYDETAQQVMPGRYTHAGGIGGVAYGMEVYGETEHVFTIMDSWGYESVDGVRYSTAQNEEATEEEYEAVRARYRRISLLD